MFTRFLILLLLNRYNDEHLQLFLAPLLLNFIIYGGVRAYNGPSDMLRNHCFSKSLYLAEARLTSNRRSMNRSNLFGSYQSFYVQLVARHSQYNMQCVRAFLH